MNRGIAIFLCLLFMAGCSASPKATPKPPEVKRTSVATKKPGAIRIVLDPGHGGESAGAVASPIISKPGVADSRRTIAEKDVVLSISLELAEMLQNRLGIEVILTRASDRNIPLEARAEMANEVDANLFLSIHANASEGHRRKGIEVYYLDNTDDEASLKLAERENARPRSAEEQDLSFIVSDVIQTAKLDESITLAHYLYDALLAQLRGKYTGVRGNGVMKAPFSVLVGAHMPSVLVEVSYIDHPEEGRRLATSTYQRHVAEGIFEGVKHYLNKTHPRGNP